MANSPFEIPQTLRDLSEQNLKQAHAAYEQFTHFLSKAMNAWEGALPENPMTAGFKDVQSRAMDIALENAESAFTFAGKICNAPTPQDIGALQTQFTQERIEAFVTQTQQLFRLMGDALQKSERGAGGTPGAMPSNAIPSNLMDAGLRTIQDRAVAMAKNNAETSLALIEKVAKAKSFQELSTLQVHFAQQQMQAYTTQMQELQALIGATLQNSERS